MYPLVEEPASYSMLAGEFRSLGVETGMLLLALRRQRLPAREIERALASRFGDLAMLARGLGVAEARRAQDDEAEAAREDLGVRVTAMRLGLFLRQRDFALLTGVAPGSVARDEALSYANRPLATTRRLLTLLSDLHDGSMARVHVRPPSSAGFAFS